MDIKKYQAYSLLLTETKYETLKDLKKMTESLFGEVYCAVNEMDTRLICEENNINIAVVELSAENKEKIEIAKMLKRDFPEIVIVLSLDFDEPSLFKEAIKYGFFRFIPKKIDMKTLLSVINLSSKQMVFETDLDKKYQQAICDLHRLKMQKQAIEQAVIIAYVDNNNKYTSVSQGFCDYFGLKSFELIGQDLNKFKHPSDAFNPYIINEAISNFGFFKTMSEDLTAKSRLKYSNLSIFPIKDKTNQIIEYIHIREDITSTINRIYVDPLTGFPNRAELLKDIKHCKNPFLAFFNINSFKETNDFYGNEVGDFLLNSICAKMQEFAIEETQESKTYKLSGDEFAVLMDEKDINLAIKIIQTIKNRLEKLHFRYSEYEIEIDFSVGYVHERENMLIKADMAVKEARKTNKELVDYKDIYKTKETFQNNIEWTKKLKKTLQEDRIAIFFQPIVDIKTGLITKYECLVRMISEKGEVITPFYFLHIAYKTGLSKLLTKRIIEKSFAYFKHKPFDFSINLAMSDLLDEDIREFLLKKIKEYDMYKRLVIEIIESEEMLYEDIKSFLEGLRAKGVRLAVDDFGTGYSNFIHFLNIDIDIIKIDGSIIKSIDQDPQSFAIAKTIVDFARGLNLEIIAEFVHSKAVLDKIGELGISLSQGFYTGEPKKETA